MQECYYCGQPIRIGILSGGKTNCERCFDFKNAPMLILAISRHSDSLYYPRDRVYIRRSMGNLIDCGFKLYRRTVFLNSENSSDMKEHLVFRYFGKLRCNLIRDHKWPRNLPVCTSFNC